MPTNKEQDKTEKKIIEQNIDYVKFNKKRILIDSVFSKSAGEEIIIAGWVSESRALGKIKFLLIKDISGIIQLVATKEKVPKEVFDLMGKLSRESVVYVKGIIKNSKQAPNGKEIVPIELKLISASKDLPIDVSDYSKTDLAKRLDYRYVDLHNRRTQAIFKIESTVMQAYRQFMIKERAIEAQFPSIIATSSEGGTELFKAKYFNKNVFLSQSCQLYKQMLACSMEKVFAIFNVWRAEKHNTTKHLNESRQLDYEQAFADEFVVMKVLERCINYIIKEVSGINLKELEFLKVKLRSPNFKYMTFEEVKKISEKEGTNMGTDDLNTETEKKLGLLYPDTVIFIHDWPISGKPFYIMPKEKNLSRGFDAIYKGIEISSGGQRVHIPDILRKQLREKNLNVSNFKSYIDSFMYGAPPHAGWAVGLERLTMVLLDLPNIREATLFPRDKERISP